MDGVILKKIKKNLKEPKVLKHVTLIKDAIP